MPRKPLFPCFSAACAALLLCGCAASASSSRSILMAAPPQSQSLSAPAAGESAAAPQAPKEDVPMRLSTAANTLSMVYAGSDDGAYTLAVYGDASADLLYFDYAALRMTRLENPPKEDAAAAGFIQSFPGGAVPLYSEGALFLFHMGGAAVQEAHGDAGRAAILRMNADASAPARAVLPDGWSFVPQSAVLREEGYLYFLMTEPRGETVETILVRLDIPAMACEEVRRFEAGYEYSLEGWWRMGPIVQAATSLPAVDHPDFNALWATRQFILYAEGMNSGLRTELARWNQGTSACVQGNMVYLWSPEGDAVLQLNADDGAQSVLAQGFAPEGYVQATLNRTMLDGKLRLQFSTQRYMRDYIIDPATGAVTETPVSDLGDNITVCAETPDAFLVSYGEAWADKGKVPYSFVPGMDAAATPGYAKMPQYALIAKADYWAGRRTFIPLEDAVFGARPRGGGAAGADAAAGEAAAAAEPETA